MGLNITPQFRLVANSEDITAAIRDRFKNLRLTDEAGTTSDTLEVELADHDPARPIAIPPTGAELELFLGYDGSVRRMGLFVCDEVELSGWPGTMILRARAAPYEKSTQGKTDLQTQKTRSWKAGTTIGAMVRKIAQEHGLESAVSESLASIALPHTDQSQESDMNLLVRLAKRYDAIAKPAGGKLIFAKRGDGKSASGQDLPNVTLKAGDCSRFSVTIARRDSPGTVVAYYRDVKAAKRKEVKVGDGDPVRRLRMAYKDQASAKAAAEAEQAKRARAEAKLRVSFPGDPQVTAEAKLTLVGFRDGVDGEWLACQVEHYLGPNGYTTSVEAERPNSNADVTKARGGQVQDEEQPATDEGG